MCDNDSSDLAEHSAQRFSHRRLGMNIQRGKSVVEHQYGGPDQDCPGQRQPLTLTTGQAHALLSDPGLQSEGKVVDEVRSSDLDGPGDLRVGGGIVLGATQGEVLGYRHRKQRRILERDGHLPAKCVERQVANIDAVDADAALGDIVKSRQERGQDRFAGSGRTDQRQRLAGFDGEAHVAQHPAVIQIVCVRTGIGESEADVV